MLYFYKVIKFHTYHLVIFHTLLPVCIPYPNSSLFIFSSLFFFFLQQYTFTSLCKYRFNIPSNQEQHMEDKKQQGTTTTKPMPHEYNQWMYTRTKSQNVTSTPLDCIFHTLYQLLQIRKKYGMLGLACFTKHSDS